jgi:acetyl-CoA carboxylase carboxyl transferase subunit alpha
VSPTTLDFERPILELEQRLEELRRFAHENPIDMGTEIAGLEKKIHQMRRQVYGSLTPLQRVKLARHPERPYTLDYVSYLCDEFHELHGDRAFADDQALVGGLARMNGRRLMILGHQKGRDTKENLRRNFGSAHPEGYRKALRLMKLAARFDLPVLVFIDTPGAYPGVGAEERHVAEAIAVNIREMTALPTPVIVTIIGEGGSGGALGVGVGDRLLMLENAYYSVISPEGCAAILWKDRAHADKAAAALKLGAGDLRELGIVDEIIPEPLGGAHHDAAETAEALGAALVRHLGELERLPVDALLESRYAKYRHIGIFREEPADSAGQEKAVDEAAEEEGAGTGEAGASTDAKKNGES